jgi:hypothetical protein
MTRRRAWRSTALSCSRVHEALGTLEQSQGAVVTGVAGIDEIGPGVVRVSYFMEFEESHDGDRERKIVDYQIWSLPQLMDNLLVMQKALKEMRAMRGQPKLVQAAGMH